MTLVSGGGASRVRWVLVFWLFVLSGISYLDRVNISIAGSSLAEEYHLSQVRLGWVFTAFLLGYALFQTPGGWLVDRFGPRRVLTVGVVWWGIFTALTASLPTKVWGAVVFFMSGAISSRRWRSDYLSLVEPVRVSMDPLAGARQG